MKNNVTTPNSWEKLYELITKEYLDKIPLRFAAEACENWRHGIVEETRRFPEYPE